MGLAAGAVAVAGGAVTVGIPVIVSKLPLEDSVKPDVSIPAAS